MLNKVVEIFKESYYEILQDSEMCMILRKAKDNEREYILIANINKSKVYGELVEEVEKIEKYYDSISLDFQDVDKNITALYLLNIETSSNLETYSNFIYELEESVYGMKRNVLYYTNYELEELKKLNQKDSLANSIKEIVCSIDSFEKFKQSPEENPSYNICSKLFIKLNCFNYPFKPNKEFTYLASIIKHKVDNSKELNVPYDDVEKNLEEVSLQNITNLELYNSLLPKIELSMGTDIEDKIEEKMEFYLEKYKGEKR